MGNAWISQPSDTSAITFTYTSWWGEPIYMTPDGMYIGKGLQAEAQSPCRWIVEI